MHARASPLQLHRVHRPSQILPLSVSRERVSGGKNLRPNVTVFNEFFPHTLKNVFIYQIISRLKLMSTPETAPGWERKHAIPFPHWALSSDTWGPQHTGNFPAFRPLLWLSPLLRLTNTPPQLCKQLTKQI